MESLSPAKTLGCKKCKGPSTTILRKSDWYCDDCVILNTNHKFRSCIGKNRILSSNEKVMVCLSGGPGSAAMLDLVYSGISLDSHKKLRISPVALHIIEYENHERCTSLVQQCKKYDFDIYIVHISEYIKSNSKLPEKNVVPQVNKSMMTQFNTMLTSSSATGENEVIKKIKRSLFIRYANLLECTAIFTGETTTTLATNLLTNLALGCGPHIEHDVGFCDKRNTKVILRPMKDITNEELDHYIKIKKLLSIIHHSNNEIKENSLQSIIGAFVTDLQENFQATVSTVCKIADKVGVQTRNHHKCVFCESDLDVKDLKLSALEATKLSRTLSSEILRGENVEHNIFNFQNGRTTDQTMFPFIHKTLCYCCSKNLAEIKKCNMPCELQKDLSGM